MKKLRLSLEALRVESFATADRGARGKGTVEAHGQPASKQCTVGCIPFSDDCFTGADGATCPPIHTCPECAYTIEGPDCPDTTGPSV